MVKDEQGYYPELTVAPTLTGNSQVSWNDFQPAVWNPVTKLWNAWVLEDDGDQDSLGTSWRKVTSPDMMKWSVAEVTIPKNVDGFGDVWTGQCVIDTDDTFGYGLGAWCYFATAACPDANGHQNQSVVLWVAPDGETRPECKGILLANPWGGNAHFRDPSVRFVGSIAEMTITTGSGISIYQYSVQDKNWFKTQDIPAPYNTVECAQRFSIWSDDLGRVVEIVMFSGNVFDRTPLTQTTVSMFAILTPCASGYCMTSMSADVTNMFLDAGSDFYTCRLFYGHPSVCDPVKRRVYGMAWIGNWDYQKGIPTNGWNGQLSLTYEVTLVVDSTGKPRLKQEPILPAWKMGYIEEKMDWVGDYSNIPFRYLPKSCEMYFTFQEDVKRTFPDAITLAVYGGEYAAAKLELDFKNGKATVSRIDYGGRPYGDLSSWNYKFPQTIGTNTNLHTVRVIMDSNTLTWIVDDVYKFTQVVLYPAGAQAIWVHIPDGCGAVGTSAIRHNEYPSKPGMGYFEKQLESRFMDINRPVITTYSGKAGTSVNHPVLQLSWVTDDTDSGTTTGLVGMIDDYNTGAKSMELKANALGEDYNAFKEVAVTSPKSSATSKQVLQLFCDQNTSEFSAVVGEYGTTGVTMEPRLDEFKKVAVTSFEDGPNDTTGNRLIRQITYNVKGDGYRAIIAPLSDKYKETINAGGDLPDDPGDSPSGSGNSGGGSGSSGSSSGSSGSDSSGNSGQS